MSDPPVSLRFFDPTDEFFVIERDDLPHWAQAGTVCFITWRTWDSIPAEVFRRWLDERDRWLNRHRINPRERTWRDRLSRLPIRLQRQFHNQLSARWEQYLDDCHGSCVLRRPELGTIVADSLLHFNEDRYLMTDFVVMPNHVHLLAAFPSADGMLKQCDSWKHYTAVRINRVVGRSKRFWEVDGFDHLVRSLDQFEYYRKYIVDNPRRAKLREGEYIHYTREL